MGILGNFCWQGNYGFSKGNSQWTWPTGPNCWKWHILFQCWNAYSLLIYCVDSDLISRLL